ncbi:CPBP family intramembrane metalloprotease [Paracoccus sp. S-4012]|nr:CPBP family intramembrane glutamic endopeptidase [Paracoccus sp. S-4012]MRX49346.1 CPBP family intramembrane metalloprotease [Paracoccus sp. S-4012]
MAGAAVPEVASPARRARLWAEFAVLFVAVPVAIAVALPPQRMFQALFVVTLAGLVILWRTGGFDWRGLMRGWRRVPWLEAGLIALAVLAAGLVLLTLLRPEARFLILRQRPEFMLLIWALYPIFSALPQELVFRALFFHRYGALVPHRPSALIVNAGVFSLAHLMYWSPVVLAMTFVGGWLFARAYVLRGFPAAWVLHAVAGNAVFAVGLGTWFYSGNVVRPF